MSLIRRTAWMRRLVCGCVVRMHQRCVISRRDQYFVRKTDYETKIYHKRELSIIASESYLLIRTYSNTAFDVGIIGFLLKVLSSKMRHKPTAVPENYVDTCVCFTWIHGLKLMSPIFGLFHEIKFRNKESLIFYS